MMISTMSNKKLLKTAAAVVFWVVLWQVAAVLVNRELLISIPTPIVTVKAFFNLIGEVEFWQAVLHSILRITAGYILAVIVGAVGGYLSAKNEVVRTLFAPVVHTVRAVPVASVIILFFLWLTKSQIPVFISFLMVFPIIWGSVEGAISSLDRGLIEMAQVMGMSKKQILMEITVPSIMPQISSALIGGLGFAWKSGVAAEVIARTDFSIGNMLWAGKNAIDYPLVFALTLAIIILSFLLENVLKLILRRWQK